jgi:hypothetical protein
MQVAWTEIKAAPTVFSVLVCCQICFGCDFGGNPISTSGRSHFVTSAALDNQSDYEARLYVGAGSDEVADDCTGSRSNTCIVAAKTTGECSTGWYCRHDPGPGSIQVTFPTEQSKLNFYLGKSGASILCGNDGCAEK